MVSMSADARAVSRQFVGVIMFFRVKTAIFIRLEAIPKMQTTRLT